MRCNRCGCEGRTIFVHGHEQCSQCHSVVEDCCQGITVQETSKDSYYVEKQTCKYVGEKEQKHFISPDQFNNKGQKK
jgi:hypothetical protein